MCQVQLVITVVIISQEVLHLKSFYSILGTEVTSKFKRMSWGQDDFALLQIQN